MRKRISTLFATVSMCGIMLFGSVAGNYVPVNASDTNTRIAEIEQQISDLQNELAALKKEKSDTADGDYISESEYINLFADADSFSGKDIKIAGQMLNSMEQDDEYKYFQMIYDLNGSRESIIVRCDLNTPTYVNDDYIMVIGKVIGSASGTNLFGGSVSSIGIDATYTEKTDYASAVDPALKTLDLNLQIDQYGYVVILEKVEFSSKETRAYVTVTNNGGSAFSLSRYSAKIVQGASQYESDYNYDANYPEVQTDLLPGITTSGIICFPAIDMNSNFDIYFEGHSDNWNEEINTYQFIIQA